MQWELHNIHFKNVYCTFIIYILPLKRCALTYCYRMIHIEYNDNNEALKLILRISYVM